MDDVLKINLTIPGQWCAGFGDCVTWAWIAAGVSRPLAFAANGPNADLLRMLGCDVTDDATGAVDPTECYRKELDLRGRAPRVEIGRQYWGSNRRSYGRRSTSGRVPQCPNVSCSALNRISGRGPGRKCIGWIWPGRCMARALK